MSPKETTTRCHVIVAPVNWPVIKSVVSTRVISSLSFVKVGCYATGLPSRLYDTRASGYEAPYGSSRICFRKKANWQVFQYGLFRCFGFDNIFRCIFLVVSCSIFSLCHVYISCNTTGLPSRLYDTRASVFMCHLLVPVTFMPIAGRWRWIWFGSWKELSNCTVYLFIHCLHTCLW